MLSCKLQGKLQDELQLSLTFFLINSRHGIGWASLGSCRAVGLCLSRVRACKQWPRLSPFRCRLCCSGRQSAYVSFACISLHSRVDRGSQDQRRRRPHTLFTHSAIRGNARIVRRADDCHSPNAKYFFKRCGGAGIAGWPVACLPAGGRFDMEGEGALAQDMQG